MTTTSSRRFFLGTAVILFFFIPSIFSQNIELPSVTSTITGETEEADEEALPDFSQVLPPEENVLPQLNDSRFSPESNTLDLGSGGMNENDMYLSGFFGGGFPGLFIGDFSIFKTSLKNPFTFHFLHSAHNGYGMNSPSDGFYDSLTRLDGEAVFNVSDAFSLKTRGLYRSNTIGLQNQSPLFSSLSSQTMQGSVTGGLNFSNILSFYSSLDGFVTNQYGSVKFTPEESSSSDNPDFSTFLLVPSAGFSFKGSSISFSLDAQYNFTGSIRSSEYGHRGAVYAALSTTASIFDAGLRVGGVFLNTMQLVPFDLYLTLRGKTALSEKDLSVTFAGGMESKQVSLFEMQDEHLFTLYNTIPSEQSDWFADVKFYLPIADFLSSDINLGFKSTAFENGVLMPDYTVQNEQNSLFDLSAPARNELISDIAVKYSIDLFSLALGWRSSWLDASVVDQRQLIYVSTFITSKESKLRSRAEIEFEPMRDLVPDISLGAYYSVTPSFSLALEIEDVVKLVTCTDRIIAYPYTSRSGSALITAKFYF